MNLKEIKRTLTPVTEKGDLLIKDVYNLKALLEFRKTYIRATVAALLILLLIIFFLIIYSLSEWLNFESILGLILVVIFIIIEYLVYLVLIFWYHMNNMLPKVFSNGFEDYYVSAVGTKHKVFVPFIDISGLYVDVDKKIKRMLAGYFINQAIINKSKKQYSQEKIDKKIEFYSSGFREDYLYITAKNGFYLFLIKRFLTNKDELVNIFREKGIEIVSLQKTGGEKAEDINEEIR